MSPKFTAKREDGRSAGQVLADYITGRVVDGTLNIGDVIPHSELTAELDSKQDSGYYQAVGQAMKLLERNHGRSLQAVRGAGYRFIAGKAQLDKGRGYQARSRRAVGRAVAVVQTIDDTTLDTADDRALVRNVARGLAAVGAILTLQAERLAEHETELRSLKASRLEDRARVVTTEREISDIKERLAKIEQG